MPGRGQRQTCGGVLEFLVGDDDGVFGQKGDLRGISIPHSVLEERHVQLSQGLPLLHIEKHDLQQQNSRSNPTNQRGTACTYSDTFVSSSRMLPIPMWKFIGFSSPASPSVSETDWLNLHPVQSLICLSSSAKYVTAQRIECMQDYHHHTI